MLSQVPWWVQQEGHEPQLLDQAPATPVSGCPGLGPAGCGPGVETALWITPHPVLDPRPLFLRALDERSPFISRAASVLKGPGPWGCEPSVLRPCCLQTLGTQGVEDRESSVLSFE